MTDVFFPENPPDREELKLIRDTIQYTPSPPRNGRFIVKSPHFKKQTDFCDPFGQTSLPDPYYTHVCHFLWRHHLLMHIDRNSRAITLPNGLLSLVQRYMFYMDAIIESLLMPARRRPAQQPNFRSATFDLYLVTEHQIGRHECDIVDQWRCSHRDIILEVIDVTSLDWKTFYDSQDNLHPVWSGVKYDFDITRVPKGLEAHRELANAAAVFFGFEAIGMEERNLRRNPRRNTRTVEEKKRVDPPSDDIPEPFGESKKPRKAIRLQ